MDARSPPSGHKGGKVALSSESPRTVRKHSRCSDFSTKSSGHMIKKKENAEMGVRSCASDGAAKRGMSTCYPTPRL